MTLRLAFTLVSEVGWTLKRKPPTTGPLDSRFGKGVDFTLWIRQELVSLLEDDAFAFRIVSHIGYLRDDVIGYTVVKKCLEKQFAPPGFTWHSRRALSLSRSLLHVCECWLIELSFMATERQAGNGSNQFINGVLSSTIQLKLLQKQPQTLDDAVTLASDHPARSRR